MRILKRYCVALAVLASAGVARADEGMWLPLLVEKYNIGQMTEMGFRLSAEDIYSVNQACLKDAIVALDHGSCTAELISAEGLLITNHHCGYGEIQKHSSVEHDYLTDGFWAMTRDQELPNPGKTASFLIRAEDVTAEVLAGLTDDMPEAQRWDSISTACEEIKKRVEAAEPGYRATVQGLLGGNQYMLFVYEDFRDIRLVGAPPESIGKFGADTDNWMWPRHTGDFTIFRIYADKDNKPADYSADNVPYRPKRHLSISLAGINEGDFAMIMGYPGSTDRYLTSWGVENLMANSNAVRAHIRGVKQDIWSEAMDADDATRIQYSSKFAGSSNYWKYSIGQNQGLKNLNVVGKKQGIEADFRAWAAKADPKYAAALDSIKAITERNAGIDRATTILFESLYTEGFRLGMMLGRLANTLKNTPDSAAAIAAQRATALERVRAYYKDFNPQLDLRASKALLKIALADLDPAHQPAFLAAIAKKHKGDVDAYVDKVLAKSAVYDLAKLEKLIQTGKAKDMDKDPAVSGGAELQATLRAIFAGTQASAAELSRANRLFIDGLMQMQPDRVFYPDANSTMRVTYGKVGGYKARDAVYYDLMTTLDGVMEKENPNEREFNVMPRLKELYEKKDYGRYADSEGRMPVGFLTNNDITGGNSGSPVLNANGELIGLAFDGNWEAMSGDIAFEPALQRTICVDIRFVLFVVEKYAGAGHLLSEMTIVE